LTEPLETEGVGYARHFADWWRSRSGVSQQKAGPVVVTGWGMTPDGAPEEGAMAALCDGLGRLRQRTGTAHLERNRRAKDFVSVADTITLRLKPERVAGDIYLRSQSSVENMNLTSKQVVLYDKTDPRRETVVTDFVLDRRDISLNELQGLLAANRPDISLGKFVRMKGGTTYVNLGRSIRSPQDLERRPRESDYPIFREDPQSRLAAEEVAYLDACAKLQERVSGSALNARWLVGDSALEEMSVESRVQTLAALPEELAKRYSGSGLVEIAVLTHYRTEDDKEITLQTVGRGAITDAALRKIEAMAAAELDCFRKLVTRVFNKVASSERRVRNGIAGDTVRSEISAVLKGVKFTDYTWEGDMAKATGELKIQSLARALGTGPWFSSGGATQPKTALGEDSYRVLVETGMAAVKAGPR